MCFESIKIYKTSTNTYAQLTPGGLALVQPPTEVVIKINRFTDYANSKGGELRTLSTEHRIPRMLSQTIKHPNTQQQKINKTSLNLAAAE